MELVDRTNFLLKKYEGTCRNGQLLSKDCRFEDVMTSHCICRYEKFIPDQTSKEKAAAKGAFEECYVDLIDQINTLTLVRKHRPMIRSNPISFRQIPVSPAVQKAEETGNELNRAVKAALNAELRLVTNPAVSKVGPVPALTFCSHLACLQTSQGYLAGHRRPTS